MGAALAALALIPAVLAARAMHLDGGHAAHRVRIAHTRGRWRIQP